MSSVPIRERTLLTDLALLAETYGDDLLREDVMLIVEQTENDTASVAVLGQFKRGKSTLLNALLGEDVLPTGRLPLTGVPTRVGFGPRAATVQYLDGRSEQSELSCLSQFVTEELNPHNGLGVAYVDVRLPVPILRGILLIDTPGIGSTFTHNTKTAREASERVDLGIFVTGAEPPITAEEVAFLRRIHELAERVIVVVGKLDLVPGEEAEVLAFTHSVLDDALPQRLSVYGVDATRRDERIARLRESIVDLVAQNGGDLARRSRSRRIRRAVARIRQALELRRAAVLLPAVERERARAAFAELADGIDERGHDLVRAIEHFPAEELVSIDVLLDTLVEEATDVLKGEVDRFLTMPSAQGTRTIHERVAAFETDWCARVADALEKRIAKRRASAMRVLAELEDRFAQAASDALGLRWNEEADAERGEFGAREAATRMNGPVPTTGLELLTGGIFAAIPGPLRPFALRKRYNALVVELLDRSKGRVRSAAMSYLLEWRFANVGFIRERLIAARRVVEDAFEHAEGTADDAAAQTAVLDMEHDEGILDAIASAFA